MVECKHSDPNVRVQNTNDRNKPIYRQIEEELRKWVVSDGERGWEGIGLPAGGGEKTPPKENQHPLSISTDSVGVFLTKPCFAMVHKWWNQPPLSVRYMSQATCMFPQACCVGNQQMVKRQVLVTTHILQIGRIASMARENIHVAVGTF